MYIHINNTTLHTKAQEEGINGHRIHAEEYTSDDICGDSDDKRRHQIIMQLQILSCDFV